MVRLVRAVYRFQLFCRVTGYTPRGAALSVLLNTLEPWEIKELFSFYQFALEVYDNRVTGISGYLHLDNHRSNNQDRRPTSDRIFNFDWEGKLNYQLPTL